MTDRAITGVEKVVAWVLEHSHVVFITPNKDIHRIRMNGETDELLAIIREEFPAEPDGLEQLIALLRSVAKQSKLGRAHLKLYQDGAGHFAAGGGVTCPCKDKTMQAWLSLGDLRDKIRGSAEQTKQANQRAKDISIIDCTIHNLCKGKSGEVIREAFARIRKTLEAKATP